MNLSSCEAGAEQKSLYVVARSFKDAAELLVGEEVMVSKMTIFFTLGSWAQISSTFGNVGWTLPL